MREDDVTGSLFDEDGEREFLAWCNAPATRGGAYGVTRFLESLHENRPDLRAAYPDLDDPASARGIPRLGAARTGRRRSRSPTQLLPDVVLPAAPERVRRPNGRSA